MTDRKVSVTMQARQRITQVKLGLLRQPQCSEHFA